MRMGRSGMGGGVVDHRRGDPLDVTIMLAFENGKFFVVSLSTLAIERNLSCSRSEDTQALALEGPSSTNANHPHSQVEPRP